jgi:hypothetical protein
MKHFKPNKEAVTKRIWENLSSNNDFTVLKQSRITCSINHLAAPQLSAHLNQIGIKTVFIESGRIMRQLVDTLPFGLPGTKIKINNSPVDIFRFTVARKHSLDVIKSIINAVKLYLPGRGSIFTQELLEVSNSQEEITINPQNDKNKEKQWQTPMLQNLANVICIISTPGKADKLAQVALELGTCIPLITKGQGTGIRDKIGLLRIAIPPDKELVHLTMPEHDFNSVFKLLIEEVGLNNPGSGYIYRTPASYGMLDQRMRIGKQKYAATMDQIIAAIDQLKTGTDWRKRIISSPGSTSEKDFILPQDHSEISIISLEKKADQLINAAIDAGASGATTTRIQQIKHDETENENQTKERTLCTLSVPSEKAIKIFEALLEAGNDEENKQNIFQLLDSPSSYRPDEKLISKTIY